MCPAVPTFAGYLWNRRERLGLGYGGHMPRLGFADRDDLLRWADTVSARADFPRLIRRLALETTPDAVRLGFAAGSGTSVGDWDGSIRSDRRNPFVPSGQSVWELSVEKLREGRFRLRQAARDPDGSPTLDAVYVEAILRVWRNREKWANGKRADRRWKDVRAYGVDDVEGWLDTAPVTHAWVSELLGLGPYGYRAAESWWRDWARATTPTLPSSLITAGRDDAAATLTTALSGPLTLTTIRGGSTEDVLAFIAAVLDLQALEGNPGWRARAAFVDERASWRALAGRRSPLILVPASGEAATEATGDTPHHILIPVLGSARPDIDLPAIDAHAATAALVAAGVSDQRRADELGRLARRSLLALRRNLANKPELHTPAWAGAPSRTLRGVLLAGRWDERSSADMSVVSGLTGNPYEAVRETLAELARAEDPMVSRLGSTWTLVSAQDAWIQLCESVRPDDLDRLEPVVRRVLLEVDPALELAPEEQWRAGVLGKTHVYSAELRRGLAATLALLGVHGGAIELEHGADGKRWAAYIVGELLSAANADRSGGLWNSMHDVLRRLAEAAPDAFLDGVRDATAGDAPILAAMFTDRQQAGALTAPSRHTQLLWSLEILAWSPLHFGRVMELLARLAEIDPGGRTSNRPAASLRAILCPWRPQTSVSAEGRLAALDAMRQRHPGVAWELMLTLLPSFHDIQSPTAEPEFRDWKEGGPTNA